MKQQCQYESNFPIITFNHRPLSKDCRPLVEVSGQAVVGRGWRFSPADVQQLPAELETGTLWPLVCAAARRGPGGVPQGKAGDGDGWDALAALDWFQRVKELDLRPFLAVYNQSQRGLAVVERLKMANLGPESIVLDGLSLPDSTDTEDGYSLAGSRYVDTLRSLSLHKAKLSHSFVVHGLAALTNLQELNLSETGITDKELLALSGLTRLERLQLRSCNITDCGLAALAKMPLTTLDLEGNPRLFDFSLSASLPLNFGDRRVLMIGLDGAGKTALLCLWHQREKVNTVPTIGFNVEKIASEHASHVVWDVGGQERIRPLWSGRSLLNVFQSEEMPNGVALVVIATWQDVPGAASPAEVEKAMDIEKLMRESRRKPSSCVVMGASPSMEETELRAPLRYMDSLAQNAIIQSQIVERVEHLRPLAPTLTSLSLGKTNITGQGLAHLTYLTRLEHLKFRNGTINDPLTFSGMPWLKKLNLRGCSILGQVIPTLGCMGQSWSLSICARSIRQATLQTTNPLSLLELIVECGDGEEGLGLFPPGFNIRNKKKKESDGAGQQGDASSKHRSVMLGLGNSGKTTLLYREKLGEVVTTMPTIGFNVETLWYPRLDANITMWDVGGQRKLRSLWRHYWNEDQQSLVWVVDASDREQLPESKQELHRELANNRDAFLLVLANKCDLPNIMPLEEISQGLDLAGLGNPYILHECSATTGVGVTEALHMLAAQLNKMAPTASEKGPVLLD
ncbi:ADPribosylation factor subfamily protein [Acanthamoeba castellanii str. Neff]|uniref:ADPribosylation factor subfamily protein n=1 Tax=Acanthamoeba castellanii (strain ATCC 30010 / Neff) TaxID=1257118 RepID=L8H553_ACACF|nr:ADPribosylation factor subfamily protein [Acanthamoeba castellanii str. Neff]ELR20372.1 ADPribosylation factor subfamily protein [Acanthamoeba castellanii str. Neff]